MVRLSSSLASLCHEIFKLKTTTEGKPGRKAKGLPNISKGPRLHGEVVVFVGLLVIGASAVLTRHAHADVGGRGEIGAENTETNAVKNTTQAHERFETTLFIRTKHNMF